MSEKKVLKIEGMTCEHCVSRVTEAIKKVDGIKYAKVSLKKNEATIKFEAPATIEDIAFSISEAGYRAF